MLLTWISGHGLGFESGKSLLSSVVTTEQKCSFNMFALVLLPFVVSPSSALMQNSDPPQFCHYNCIFAYWIHKL